MNTHDVAGVPGRHRHVLAHVTGRSLLDVGCADGAFLDLAHASRKVARLAGVDDKEPKASRLRNRRKRLWDEAGPFPLETDRYEGYHLDAVSLPFADGEFDTVTAMEILEHQEGKRMNRMLAELRRVAGRRLVITVPYEEAWPSKVRGHHQRFSEQRIRSLFRSSERHLLVSPTSGFPWVCIIEERE